MAQLLDEEMPAGRRRKPVFWFWLLGLLLLGGGTWAWRHWQTAEPATQPTQGSAAPVATLPQSDRTKPAAGSESTPTNGPERRTTLAAQPSPSVSPFASGNTSAPLRVVAPRNAAASIAAVPLLAPSAPTTNTSVSQETPSEIYQTAPPSVAEPSNSTVSTSPPESAANLLFPAPPATSAIPEPGTATAPASSPEQVASPAQVSATTNTEVTELTVEDATTMTAPPANPAAEPILPKRHKTWAWGATASLVLNGQFKYAGVGAGLNVDWQPFRRWGLRSGLGYQYLPLPSNERPILSLNASSYVAATGDDRLKNNFGVPVASVDPNAQAVFVSITRFHRLEVPLMAYWQPFSKWRVLGGVSLGNTVYTETGKQGLTNSIVFDIADGSANSSLNKEVSQSFRTWDLQWNLGLSFRPLRHLELSLYYQRGFSHSNTAADLLANKYSDIANYYPAQSSTSGADLLQQSSASVVTGGSKILANLSWFF